MKIGWYSILLYDVTCSQGTEYCHIVSEVRNFGNGFFIKETAHKFSFGLLYKICFLLTAILVPPNDGLCDPHMQMFLVLVRLACDVDCGLITETFLIRKLFCSSMC